MIKQLRREEKRMAGYTGGVGSFTQSGLSGSSAAHLHPRSDSGVRGAAASVSGSEDGSRTSRTSRMLSHFKTRRG